MTIIARIKAFFLWLYESHKEGRELDAWHDRGPISLEEARRCWAKKRKRENEQKMSRLLGDSR